MKKSSLIIGLMLVTSVIHAQDYIPLLDTNRMWSHYLLYPHGGPYSIIHYKIGGDTVLNEVSYKRVMQKYIVPDFGYWSYTNYVIRETGSGEVFRRYARGAGTEELILDFNLEEGGYFDTGLTIGGQPLMADVVTVDSILISDTYRKRIIFDEWFDEIWIEGIGSSVSPFMPFENLISTIYNCLICVHEYGSFAYQNPESWLSCTIVGVIEPKETVSFNLYPNPADDLVIIELENGVNEKYEVKIFDAQGIEIRNDSFIGNKYFLNGEDLHRGLYLIVMHSSSQSFSKKVVFH
jgi:hypothetical protein